MCVPKRNLKTSCVQSELCKYVHAFLHACNLKCMHMCAASNLCACWYVCVRVGTLRHICMQSELYVCMCAGNSRKL